ncbi:uncharacterized protein METZ01_LOCUS503674, partial [marine metagenome]
VIDIVKEFPVIRRQRIQHLIGETGFVMTNVDMVVAEEEGFPGRLHFPVTRGVTDTFGEDQERACWATVRLPDT